MILISVEPEFVCLISILLVAYSLLVPRITKSRLLASAAITQPGVQGCVGMNNTRRYRPASSLALSKDTFVPSTYPWIVVFFNAIS